jgi:hypothetical protein
VARIDVVARFPGGHAVAEGDAIQGDIGVFVTAESTEPLLAEGKKTQGGPFGAVGENAKVRHQKSCGPADGMAPSCTACAPGGVTLAIPMDHYHQAISTDYA